MPVSKLIIYDKSIANFLIKTSYTNVYFISLPALKPESERGIVIKFNLTHVHHFATALRWENRLFSIYHESNGNIISGFTRYVSNHSTINYDLQCRLDANTTKALKQTVIGNACFEITTGHWLTTLTLYSSAVFARLILCAMNYLWRELCIQLPTNEGEKCRG